MKNSIKYLFWLLITPLLCLGVSFADSNINHYIDITYTNFMNSISASYLNNPTFDWYDNMCFEFHWLSNNTIWEVIPSFHYMIRTAWSSVSSDMNTPVVENTIYCFPLYTFFQDSSTNWATIKQRVNYDRFEFSCTQCNQASNNNWYVSVYLVNSLSVNNSTPDCSSVESELSSCKSSLSGANSILSSCQSDLASCTNSCDTLVSQCQNEKSQCLTDLSTLSGSYGSCVETNASLSNYNSSLEEQLNSCLLSGSSSGDFILYEYQLSRNDWYGDLFLPITNSIKLPYWYRWFLDDGVLAIKSLNSLETAYTINNEDFNDNVIGSYWTIFLFFMSLWLFLVFVYAIRRYFIWLKSIK